MDLLSWIFTGLILGALINVVMPSRVSIGYLGSIGLSTQGAVVFGFAGSIVGIGPEGQFSIANWITAIVGALVAQLLLVAFRMVTAKQQYSR